jgi:hypothetical protein
VRKQAVALEAERFAQFMVKAMRYVKEDKTISMFNNCTLKTVQVGPNRLKRYLVAILLAIHGGLRISSVASCPIDALKWEPRPKNQYQGDDLKKGGKIVDLQIDLMKIGVLKSKTKMFSKGE